MFGYVIVNKGDLTFREFDVYHSYYCGLCKTLKEKYGVLGQLALNYDMTFLVMLLSSLYEPQTDYTREGCVTHLFMKQGISKNEITQFGADMTILLTAYKCEDDWQDEKKLSRKLYESALHGRMSKVKEKYRDKAEIIEVCFANLHRLEQENCDKPDKMAAIFGKVMEELFVYREDEWEETLRRDFTWENIFICWMPMKIWKKIKSRRITIHFPPGQNCRILKRNAGLFLPLRFRNVPGHLKCCR